MQQWRWSKANEKDLAKFVNRDAIDLLGKLSVHPFDLNQYPKGRKELVRAIYNALIARNIRYAHEKYQPEGPTQIIRTPREILVSPGEGTCLDLAVLFCGLCLGYKLLPLIVILEGHAFAAVSLNQPLGDSNDAYIPERNLFNTSDLFTGEDNLTALKKLIDEEAYIAIECTGFAHTQSFKNSSQPEAKHREDDGTLSFDRALSAGREQLENPDRSFKFAIDIAVAHHHWEIERLTIKDRLEDMASRTNDEANTPADLLEQLREIIIAARENRSVAINRDANGAFIITGDGNVIINIPSQGDVFQAGDFRYSRGAEVWRSIMWQVDSRTLLAKQLQQLTTNRLNKKKDIIYKVDDVHVPLGLSERKKQPIHITPEDGSNLGREKGIDRSTNTTDRQPQVEITKEFKHDEFLNEVFLKGQSPNSQGKRIAIIGKPGTGKTTLLQKIAKWIEEEVPSAIVIWVSLASYDVNKKSLRNYLLTQWLPNLLCQADGTDVSDPIKESFFTQIRQGRVWLLLDGLDEMQVVQGSNRLSVIQDHIQAGVLLQQMRIVMTCRLNLWDGESNELEEFDTYHTLECDYPEQVEMFITKRFALHGEESIENGKKLCMALKDPGNERIRDLLKNPLQLSLMCSSWLSKPELPKTQAELYRRFVDRIYGWRPEIEAPDRKQLNQKLAELSKAAIDTLGKERFRLRKNFVNKFLDEDIPGGKGTFLKLALDLGWLNEVYLDAEVDQPIYAFLHWTFQEYFAALGIKDEGFFLTLVPRLNPLNLSASYRVFEPQWRQVFLLWLGRENEDLDNSHKIELIKTLMKFKDRCGDFYTDRAFLLAAVGIAEFKTCKDADALVNKLVQWKFPSPDRFLSRPICKKLGRKAARVEWATNTFSRTDSQRVIKSILGVLENTEDESIRWRVVESLGKIGAGNQTAILKLIELLEKTPHEPIRREVVKSLGKIGTGNQTAILKLRDLLEKTPDKFTRQKVIEILGEIGTGNQTAIDALLRLFKNTEDESIRRKVVESLVKIGTGNQTAIEAVRKVLHNTKDRSTRQSAIEFLGKIDTGNQTAIQTQIGVLENTPYESTRQSAIEFLGKIGTGNQTVIDALLRVLENTPDDDTRRRVIESLGKIGTGNQTVIDALLRVLKNTPNDDTRRRVIESLGKIGTGNQTAIETQVRVLENIEDRSTRQSAVEILGEIGTGNETAIDALLSVLLTAKDDDTLRRVVTSLGKIGTGNQKAIDALVGQVFKKNQDRFTRYRAEESLGEIGTGNEAAILALVWVLENTPHDDRLNAVENTPHDDRLGTVAFLGEIGTGNETAIDALVKVLNNTKDDDTHRRVVTSLGKIGTGNETAIDALVGLLTTTPYESTRQSTAASLGEIGTGNKTAIQALGGVLATTPHESTRQSVAASLGKIDTGNETAIKVLVRSLRRNLRHKEAHILMMKCAELLSYRDFYQAFHDK